MNAAEYMEQCLYLHKKILTYFYEIQRLEAILKTVDGKLEQYGEKTERAAEILTIQVKSTIAKLMDKIEKSIKLLPDMLDVIDEISDPKQWDVLSRRFIYDMDWEEIEEDTGLTLPSVKRHYKDAMKNIKLPENPIFITEKYF